MAEKELELVVTSQSGKDVTTSLIVADVFGKVHSHVLRDIKNLACSQEFRDANFGHSTYKSLQGKQMPMYEITKDGFSFLAMGFTGEKAGEFKEKFIKEFNKRDTLLKNDDYIIGRAMSVLSERSKLLEQQLRQKDEQLLISEKTIEVAKPKVKYYDEVLQSNKLIATTIIAKELGMSGEELNAKLNSLGIQYKVDKAWVLRAKYNKKGYTGTKTYLFKDDKGVEKTSIQTYWTEKGREFIHKLIKNN
jgi:Rha family phage regulatory protein